MTHSDKISVIIPVLDNKSGFINAYKSVVDQSYDNIEIIVIDGGSSDGTVETIEGYSDNIAYWETGLDSGITDAFNRGIQRATGDIVGILNSDDLWEIDTIGSLLTTVKKFPDAGIYFGSLRFIDHVNQYSYIRQPDIKNIEWRMSVFHPSIFVRREVYERVGLYDKSFIYAMDSEWCHRALVNNENFRQVPGVLANMNLGGLSDVNFIQSLNEYRRSLILHKLASPLIANSRFVFYCSVKALMKIKLLYPVKRIRDKYLVKK